MDKAPLEIFSAVLASDGDEVVSGVGRWGVAGFWERRIGVVGGGMYRWRGAVAESCDRWRRVVSVGK